MKDDEYTLLKEAALLIKQRDYTEAAKLYQKIAEFFTQKGFYQKALAAYRKSLSLADDPIVCLSMARVYEKIHRNFSAYEALRQAFAQFSERKDFEQAVEVGSKMAELDPHGLKVAQINKVLPSPSKEKKIENDLNTARLLMKENLWGDAKKIYQKILESAPEHKEAKEALATISQKQEEWIKTAEALSPQDLIRSLEADLGLEKPSELKPGLVQIEPSPEALSAQMMYDLAIAYKEMGFYSEAIRLLEKALKKTKKTQTLGLNCLVLMGVCHIENHQYFEAISHLEKTFNQQKPGEIPAEYQLSLLYYLAVAFELSGNFNKALFFLRKIEKENKRYRDIEDRIKKNRQKISP